ncbi:hypothetical protein L2E82_21380 [Cichorium intybus]|uniref:Uncharacterized protein n=1 Tax=Cichorium intybus TaxID=13427 RepID=A0ACB9DVS1_CICIN|nr:hypothetical protein L2E82_21380 [Cichorium intybus]
MEEAEGVNERYSNEISLGQNPISNLITAFIIVQYIFFYTAFYNLGFYDDRVLGFPKMWSSLLVRSTDSRPSSLPPEPANCGDDSKVDIPFDNIIITFKDLRANERDPEANEAQLNKWEEIQQNQSFDAMSIACISELLLATEFVRYEEKIHMDTKGYPDLQNLMIIVSCSC